MSRRPFQYTARRLAGRAHVSESNLACVRFALSCMRRGEFWKLPRAARRSFIAAVIAAHEENRRLFELYKF
jgi:hypothetical protein